jgi:hypothetical protein
MNISELSDLLDEFAPGRKLAAAIKVQKNRIQQDIDSKGESFIEFEGKAYKITAL